MIEDESFAPMELIAPEALEPGDVLLSRGCDRTAKAISYFDGSPYSHASIWTGQGVVEAVSEGICHYSFQDSLTTHPREFLHVHRASRKRETREAAARLAIRAAQLHPKYAWAELGLAALMASLNPLPVTDELRERSKLFVADLHQLLESAMPQIREFFRREKAGCMTCSQLIATVFADAAHLTGEDPLRLKITGDRFVRGDASVGEPIGAGDLEDQLRELLLLARPLVDVQTTNPAGNQRYDPPRDSVVFADYVLDGYPPHLVSPRDLRTSPDLVPIGRLDTEALKNLAAAPVSSPRGLEPERRPSRLLFLAASPRGVSPVNIGREHAAIGEGLRASRYGQELERLSPELQVGVERLAHVVARYEPDVLHLSGHGEEGKDGDPCLILAVAFEDPQRVEARLLEGLLADQRRPVQLLVLNACHSAKIAERLAPAVGCAIGMEGRVRDSEAANFSQRFYRLIGDGYSVRSAFDTIAKEPTSAAWTPRLFDPRERAASLRFVSRRGLPPEDVAQEGPTPQRASPDTEPPAYARVRLDRPPRQPQLEVRRPYSSRLIASMGLATLSLAFLVGAAWMSHTRSVKTATEPRKPAEPTERVEPAEPAEPEPAEPMESHPRDQSVAPLKRVRSKAVSPPSPEPQQPVVTPTAPSISVIAERQGEGFRVDSAHPFALGDLYAFYLEVDEPLYALVLQVDDAARLERLYPQGRSLRLIPGAQQRIPPLSEGDFEVTSASHRERLIVLLSASPLESRAMGTLSAWLARHPDWPESWTLEAMQEVTRPPANGHTARQLLLRGSSFVPRAQRQDGDLDVAQVHFLEIAQL